ncbi:MAG: O-antigen ligase family protein, partial [Planctomycetota bacterium]
MRDRLSLGLRSIGLIGIATIAIMRCVVFFAPQVLFDVDPARDPTPIGGLGPAGSLLLDALLLGACACGLLGQALAGRKFDALLLALAVAPAPIVLWHGAGDAGDLWRGSTWLSAALACAVVAHCATDRAPRLLLIALLAAVLAPLMARGIMQVPFVGTEYAETVAAFEQNRDQFLADRGWEPDSAAARIYERRLRQATLRGWFATTNIFASLLAFAMILFGGLTIASVRARLTSGYTGLLALAALVAAAGLALSGSKGAILAALGGLVVLLAPLVLARARAFLGRFGGAIAVACVAAVLLAVCARALLLPEGFAGEKSLLFRWHYLVGSAGIFAEQPFLGVGPDGFQDAYVTVRVPRSPEEVASAHSAFADWFATLGVVGGAWVALTLLMLWRVGCAWGRETDQEEALPVRRLVWTSVVGAAAVVALGLLPAVLIEAHAIDEADLMTMLALVLMRAIGLAGFIGVAVITMYVLARSDPRLVDWSLAAAVIALLVHAQIEMTLFQPGPVVWAMCVLGVAGGAARRAGPWLGYVAASAIVLAATYLGAGGVVPAWGQQRLINEAAAVLYPLSVDQRGQLGQRDHAIDLLEAAYERWPANVLPLQFAVRQAALGAAAASGPDRVAF